MNGLIPSSRRSGTSDLPVGGLNASPNGRRPISGLLPEQHFYIRHCTKQLQRVVRKWLEALALVEAPGGLILGIDDYREGGDLASHCPIERVCQKKSAVALALVPLIDSEPAEQRRRDERIARQLARDGIRQFCHADRCRRQRIEAGNAAIGQNQHEGSGDLLARLLSGLRPKISVEWLRAARERRAIVMGAESLDVQSVRRFPLHLSDARLFAVEADRFAQPIVDRLRFSQRLHEGLAFPHGER